MIGRAWPHIRAFLISVHLMVIVIVALPAPGGGMVRSAWKDPTVQAEFDVWRGRIAAVGYPMTTEEFEDWLWATASSFMKSRSAVVAPFGPYFRWTGTYQSWRMFSAPATYPCRLWVDVREKGQWRPVYAERDRELVWMSWTFSHDRARSVVFRYCWSQYKKSWVEFADRVAIEAAADFPDAERMRIRYWQARTPSPEEARAGITPDGKWAQSQERDLFKVRDGGRGR